MSSSEIWVIMEFNFLSLSDQQLIKLSDAIRRESSLDTNIKNIRRERLLDTNIKNIRRERRTEVEPMADANSTSDERSRP